VSQGTPRAFDPDEIRILVAAFDKAWESVQASGAIFDTDTKAESARAILAKHIIEAAKHGESGYEPAVGGTRPYYRGAIPPGPAGSAKQDAILQEAMRNREDVAMTITALAAPDDVVGRRPNGAFAAAPG
jgi:hypothetical protein